MIEYWLNNTPSYFSDPEVTYKILYRKKKSMTRDFNLGVYRN